VIFLSKVLKLALNRSNSKYRHGLEIVKDMLSIVVVKSKKTRIMYQANLSYKLMEKYLGSLLESGLVECVEDSFYVITSRGKEFLQMYDDYIEKCRWIGSEIRSARKDKLLLEDMYLNNRCETKRLAVEEEIS